MRKHYNEIDRLRGIAIAMVILYHGIIVYPINLHEIVWCKILHDFLWYIEMPIFFVVSGFCFAYKGDYGGYLRKKCKRVLIPHLVFGLIEILPRIIPNPLVNKQSDVTSAMRDLVLYGGSDWFLRVLFVILALFPFIDWCYKKSKLGKIGMLFMVFFLYAVSDAVTNKMQFRMVCVYLCFFMVGYLIQKLDYENIVKPLFSNVYCMVISFLMMLLFFLLEYKIGENQWYSFVGALAGTSFFYGCCVWVKGVVRKFLEICGMYSLQIYLLGGYALVLSRTVLVSLLGIKQPGIIIVLNFLMDMAITIVISKWVLQRWKVSRILSGLQ